MYPASSEIQIENPRFLSEQIITYLGNKRALLGFIGQGLEIVKNRLNKEKITAFDVFSGSGIVARYLKQHSSFIYANDLEAYSCLFNDCYLTNRTQVDLGRLEEVRLELLEAISRNMQEGFITRMYAAADDANIKPGERVFFTRKNAMFIDTARQEIAKLPDDCRKFFLASLLFGASVHNNTSGVFKGFYKNSRGIGQFGGQGKNALSRITGDITLELPKLSNFECGYRVLQMDAMQAAKTVGTVDFAYMDPPYNQHPYGSNYFMLNLILDYKMPENVSPISGIPAVWNRSDYNVKNKAASTLFSLIRELDAKFVLISYNSEGFVKYDEFVAFLSELGKLTALSTDYSAFRGSRNLRARSLKVKEYLFLLEKN